MKRIFRTFMLLVLISALAVCCPACTGAETAAEPVTVDLDLSVMSGTVVYAQVYNLLCDPTAWLGKTIRMAGFYSAFQDQSTGTVYHACVIPDATACCAQGIEFVWAGEHAWPEDYPEDAADITVTGRLEIYEENGIKYLHIVDADLVWDPT